MFINVLTYLLIVTPTVPIKHPKFTNATYSAVGQTENTNKSISVAKKTNMAITVIIIMKHFP